ncbi:conserved Plasmodium protein, unknown function [Plasmodium gallinaceum]|uniref:Uncharacterized protein n=1 Tax=Plasmodium gallinaceum TaxID=5849 RepID=A0A1J1GXS7_PLAGA|nr:conserved Plasmodium protein, unknown function [Plasmodium gallinaceum]CRG97261.1 conserved Plasmodium protein, unknown function [Plasmodium gallinaceum]
MITNNINNILRIRKKKDLLTYIWTKRKVNTLPKNDHENIIKLLQEKYKNLRKEDRIKLINSHILNINEKDVSEIYDFSFLKEQEKEIQDEYENKRKLKILKLRKPAYLQQRKIKKRVNNSLITDNEYEDNFCTNKEKELEDIERYTLVEDLYKSYIYSKSFTLLNDQYMTKHKITNDFIYLMINSIRQNILEKIKPTLINEFAVHKNPYMLFKNSLFNFILHKYVKNPYEETLIENYINKKVSLNILKINSANVPVEIYEPLVSFRGDIHYNYNLKEKFNESINTSLNILSFLINEKKQQKDKNSSVNLKMNEENEIKKKKTMKMKNDEKKTNAEMYDEMNNEKRDIINEVLKILPENKKYHFDNYPFENLKSFKTNMRKKYVGGIKNNKPLNIEDEELSYMRYPNLQCVSHSLPKDIKYRDNVIHAIKVLERSKYWDHKSKIKAINTLIEVWNNMNSSDHYENLFDKSLPIIYSKDMLKKTKTRKETYNKGLTYIQSLTTQKPLNMRLKKN